MALRRIFKYRGKKLNNGEPTKEWAYGSVSLYYGGMNEESLFKGSMNPELYSIGLRAATIFDPRTYSTFAVVADTLGQWTGFYDVESTEIYEDDIMRIGNGVGIVEWLPERLCFRLNCNDTYAYFYNKKGTVIGNTHDNPELLTQIQL